MVDNRVATVGEQCSALLNEVAGCFKPGVKLTLVARTPGNNEADFVLTNDSLAQAIAALRRRTEADRAAAIRGEKTQKKRPCNCMGELDQCPLCGGSGMTAVPDGEGE